MKSIEEKAKEYSEQIFAKALKAPWPEAKQFFEETYLAGATEALSSQWRSVEDELPEIDKEVVVIYSHALTPSCIEKAIAYFDGEDWYTTDGTHIRPTHWMSIPELPKSESE